ncbi:hypothetical protein [Sphingomonas hengshuiensis]|uniref:Uncharacterized protein n=1 Tax=Sphingomonas hengshuiensis TaxID=1609977 RepID=A0A7U4JBG9_9SPHN|nr:hypothetical protein [Sphingomonas hengshuiensis]AJP73657.1 hypothetical protein TS85_20430 [Sphingomonas hengshuiensis]
MQRLLAIVAGLVVAMATILGIELLAHLLWPLPLPDLADTPAVAAFLAEAPGGAQTMLIGAWFAGALLGGTTAFRVADWPAAGWIVAFLVAAGGLANVLLLPYPLWMQIAAVAAPLVGGIVVSGVTRPA